MIHAWIKSALDQECVTRGIDQTDAWSSYESPHCKMMVMDILAFTLAVIDRERRIFLRNGVRGTCIHGRTLDHQCDDGVATTWRLRKISRGR